MKKAKIVGAFWFRDNTIKRYPNVAPFLGWFGTKDDDESLGSSEGGSSADED